MNSTLKTIATGACVGLVCLALAACGGGNEGDDNSNGNGSSTGNGANSGSNGGSNTSSASAPERVTEDFVTHMANREFAEAQALVAPGGSADILDAYVQGLIQEAQNPNARTLYESIFSAVTDRFAEAGVELVEQTDDSATVRVTLEGDPYDVTVTSLDGSTWTIELPGGILKPFEDLVFDAARQVPQNGNAAP